MAQDDRATPEDPLPEHWADEPLRVDADDEFGRDAFIATVARRINQATSTGASTVFGLVGPWGSGKTSVIARVRTCLADDWSVGEFTPWSTADSTAMSLEFVSALSSALGVKVKGSLRRKLAGYAKHVVPLASAIPLFGTGISGSAGSVVSSLASRAPWHKEFDELSAELGALNKRVLIVIDDVDRLTGDELMTLLKVVRLLGRFTGVHYLIAYDQATIEELLAAHGAVGRSTKFMEKIVQHPFEVPPISAGASLRVVKELLHELLTSTRTSLSGIDLERANELIGVLGGLVDTPRGLGRFREQLRSFASQAVEAELDLLDYVAVSWLRLNAHDIWVNLHDWHTELVSGKRTVGLIDSVDITTDEWEQRFAAASSAPPGDGTWQLLKFLFPGVPSRGLISHIDHPRAASDKAYLSRYLVLAVPEDDVSDRLIFDVVDALAGGQSSERESELTAILDGPDPERAYLAFQRADRHRRDANTTSRTLIEYLADRIAARSGDEPGVGVPLNALRPWAGRELAEGLADATITAEDVIGSFGEEESYALLRQIIRVPIFRDRRHELAAGFADYWEQRLDTEFDALVDKHRVGSLVELIIFARGARG